MLSIICFLFKSMAASFPFTLPRPHRLQICAVTLLDKAMCDSVLYKLGRTVKISRRHRDANPRHRCNESVTLTTRPPTYQIFYTNFTHKSIFDSPISFSITGIMSSAICTYLSSRLGPSISRGKFIPTTTIVDSDMEKKELFRSRKNSRSVVNSVFSRDKIRLSVTVERI
jgi:hypothetical protein